MKKTTQTLPATRTPAPEATPSRSRTTPPRYDETFRRQAVEHWLRSGLPGTRIARELGISYPTLKEWKRRYTGDALPQRASLEAENRALKAELARVREQRDILKKTLGILSEAPKPATRPLKR
ncbi:MAG: transposase [Phycisphaerae bacterium]